MIIRTLPKMAKILMAHTFRLRSLASGPVLGNFCSWFLSGFPVICCEMRTERAEKRREVKAITVLMRNCMNGSRNGVI